MSFLSPSYNREMKHLSPLKEAFNQSLVKIVAKLDACHCVLNIRNHANINPEQINLRGNIENLFSVMTNLSIYLFFTAV